MFNSVKVFCHQIFFVLISSISRACFMPNTCRYLPPTCLLLFHHLPFHIQLFSRFPRWILRVLHFSNPNVVFISLLHISISFKLWFSCWAVLLYILTSFMKLSRCERCCNFGTNLMYVQ